MTGNNSGAVLLTLFVLTSGAANDPFTIERAVSAVQEDDGSAGEARLKNIVLTEPNLVEAKVELDRLGRGENGSSAKISEQGYAEIKRV